jgi:transcriptional regulator with XRE-family HTH domain
MGSASRIKPDLLSRKLLAIRQYLNFNLEKMAEAVSCEKIKLRNSDISRFETGIREPSLIVLLRYARLINVSVDVLIDDELDLPDISQ